MPMHSLDILKVTLRVINGFSVEIDENECPPCIVCEAIFSDNYMGVNETGLFVNDICSLARARNQQQKPAAINNYTDSSTNLIHVSMMLIVHCVSKKIPDIIDSNLKKDCQISIIFKTNIPDKTDHLMTGRFPTSPNVSFCTTCEKQNQ